MMVIISGLPLKTKYQDVKVILKNECHITEFIMDDLVVDESGKGKKVRVGLVEDCDGYEIIQCLNGLRMPGNYVLRVEAVGKPPLGSQQHHGNYEPKAAPSYINDYRDSYPDQQSNDLRGRPHAPGLEAPYTAQESQFSGLVPHGSSANHGPISSHTPVDSLVRSSPWVANNGSNNQWNQNQSMNSQNSYQQPGNPGYAQYSSNAQRPITGPYPQGKVQHDPGYGYLDKTTNKLEMTKVPRKADARPHVLRNVELVDTQPATPALQSGRYPLNQGFQQQKPITIMKDNFQGPTTYDVGSTNPSNIYQRLNQNHSQSWVQQGQQFKPQLYPKSNADQYEKPYEEFRQYGIDKHGDLRKNIQPPLRTDVYKDFEKPAQHFSPHRVIAHSGRQFSPSRRLISPPGSHVRALSPSNQLPHGRRMSPSGKLRSPTRRLISPADRMMSSIDRRPGGPPHDLSQRHQLSPQEKFGHRNVPRYSPKRHHPDKPTDKSIDMDPLKSSKQTRSTYDVQAPNEPMNSGDFRPNVHENAPFSRSSRQLEQDVSWQHNEDQLYGKMKKRIADVHYTSRQNIYGDKHLPRRSRSPVRRDRQPVKDRFRRHSPSTSSPRRSWAFEKHRSPEVREAPPPPNWPGQSSRDDGRFKAVSDRKEDNTKHVPSWDTHAFTKIDESNRRDDKLELFAGPSKVFRDDFGNKIDKSHNEPISKPLRDPNFGGRNEFENRGGYRQTTHDEQKRGIDYHHSVERESTRRQGEFRRKESPRREEGKGNDYKGMNKEIERIYQRAQEFKEKEMRKSERRLNEYSEERDRISRIMEDKDQRAALSHRMDDTSWHHMDESSRRHMEASPRRRTDDLPRRRIEDSPRRRTEDSPGRRMEDSSRRRIENSPRRRMEHSPPRRRMEDSPRHRMEDSPRRRMKDSPRFHMDVSPRRHMEASPRRRVDDSPRQSHTDIEHRHRNESDTKTSPPNQPVWKTADKAKKLYAGLPVYIKGKINKAAEEIAVKLMSKKPMILDLNSEARHRILEELKIVVSLKLTELFDVQDVSFIELIIKFQSKISDKEQNKMFDDVIKSLPGRFRSWKTMGSDSSNMPHRKPQLFTDDRSVEETPDMLNRKLKRSPDRMMQMSSEVPLKKSKLSPEYKTKGATVAHSNHCDVYKRKKRPMNTVKMSRAQKSKILHAEKGIKKRKNLKKNDATTTAKIIKKGVSSSNTNGKGREGKKIEQKSTRVNKVPTNPVKLDALTTQVVESELQDIMIKIWQQLPDKPIDEAEQLVVDKLRNNAGDSLRNVLGLNVTKRLLKVFNSFYVQLYFTAVPKRDDIIRLMKKYKMRGLIRIQRTPVVFGAYVNTIEEFDAICSIKFIKCGPVNLTVIPAYKFDKCPKNLITNFDDKEITDDDISDINKIINKSSVNEMKTQEKVGESKEVLIKSIKEESKDVILVEMVESTKPNVEIDDKHKDKQIQIKPDKEEVKKPSNDIIETSNKVSDQKPQHKDSRPMKRIANMKQAAEETTLDDKTNKNNISSSSIKNIFIEGNDFDELDDATILALMSEGIVVDECSGSE